MAQPVLVRAYTGNTGISTSAPRAPAPELQALPPISSYAFADILRMANCQDFQNAIDGIAEICAKNRMSLADEYSSHLPPLGEITARTAIRSHSHRPGPRRALTAVPEVSSSSSDSSVKSKKRRRSIFSFRKQTVQASDIIREIRIGRMGRCIPVNGTTAISLSGDDEPDHVTRGLGHNVSAHDAGQSARQIRATSNAAASLQRILGTSASSAG